jgi:tetratricopeptide (TPR) repeat protein
MQVCRAVQHAHQKGVIHRDLKPSNILVTLHDGVPVPKVIDFGIAKATTDQRLTDKTIYTAFEQFIGTPAYMSPEQAEMSGLDIDTRSDIYSLGVLLYELLTGETPFNSKTLLQAGLDQMRRIIREQEPPRPSTRLSTLNHADLAAIAKRRHAEPPKLISSIRGDLDWIAMKCLEKDRTRRFEAVSALAMDVKRHLDNEIVVARPPSQLYRLQKLIKRNRSVLVVSAAVIAMVAVVLVVLIALLHKEEKARQRAIAAEKRRTQLSQETEPRRLDEQARALEGEGKLAEAEDSYRKLLAIQTNLFGRVNSNVANTLDNLAGVLARRQKLVEAEAAYRDLLIMRPDTLSPVENLAEVLVLQHRYAEADDLFSPLLGPGNKNQAQIGAILSARANFRARTARWREATVDMSRAVELAPNDHYNWYQLAPLLIESGDFAAYAKHRQTMLTQYGTTKDACIAERTAKACLLLPVTGQVLTIASELADTAVTVGHQDPWLAYFQFAKGLAEYRQGHFANAVEWTQQALKEPGVEYRDAQANAVLAMAYYQLKRPDVARDTLAEALDIIKPVLAKIENRDLDAAWHDWVMAQILLREARSLIENKPGAPEQPR